MAISEIPSKLIERTESLVETKLQVAAELTKIVYTNDKDPMTDEKVLKSYKKFYDSLKDLAPTPLDSPKKTHIYLLIGAIFLAFVSFSYVFFYLCGLNLPTFGGS
ncbi:hypothetical protein [Candidatus Finniella inopinata]|uniref:Uncharacterized protein n=1 Tax=Candidatus Finniella inopinata TaxID=1696036 RepID=A0A4Q7DIY8_9PROT|nr:hypothetical protein [Candidatus Finniella inopinata]RZI46951.1 hypothetical protein EQU50_01625 [Candidatus Finniella inopinata]